MELFCDNVGLSAITRRHNDSFAYVIALAEPGKTFREIVRANGGLL
jgi:hypothetical protein